MSSGPNKISRSPTPPEPDDDGEEWPVHGIVGEDVDVFGISSYEIRWQNWTRPDGTNTTWMRDIEGDPAIIASWNEAMKNQRLEKAMETQSIDLMSLASTPMHDRLTFERAQAVEEKMGERLRKGVNAPDKVYHGWMAEIDRKVAHHERRGERNPPSSKNSSKKRKRPSLNRVREASHAESSRSAASRKRRIPVAQDNDGETSTASDSDIDSVMLL
jgi:histone-lysine N-methyltransferase SUV39H